MQRVIVTFFLRTLRIKGQTGNTFLFYLDIQKDG